MNRGIIIVVICGVLGLSMAFVGGRFGAKSKSGSTGASGTSSASSGGSNTSVSSYGDDQARCVAMLDAPNHAEARQWLADPAARHVIFKWTRPQALAFVEEFYSAGAKTVWFADIDNFKGADIAAIMIVELPIARDRRKVFFEKYAGIMADREDQAENDSGQKYLMINMD